MSIREQAIALVDEFEHLKSDKISDDSYIEYPTARVCALVAVKYVLEALNTEDYNARTYWLEVQTEIEEKL